ncbi:MAG: glycosyltransferase [Actinomycetota bacterium]|nr:glycosyltransferase [Actinomycetota bacterium]
MTELHAVDIAPLPPERFRDVLDADRYDAFLAAIQLARALLKGRKVVNVNSTAYGGGVAEMLRSLLAYARGAQIDARWLVISGNPGFFEVTKRIHNHLHGASGDAGVLGAAERKIYDAALTPNARELTAALSSEDVVLLHDPQTAGLIPAVKATGATVIWRCHVGLDRPNDIARDAWGFLLPDVSHADAVVFSREAYEWEGLDPQRTTIIPPSIDAFSPKNQELLPEAVTAILGAARLIDSPAAGEARYTRVDGQAGHVERVSEFHDGGAPPPADARLVVQVSRWDRLKDPVGVIEGFAQGVGPYNDAHLIVAGPSVVAVADDPEGAEVLEEARVAWAALADEIKPKVHLATLPMEDGEENAAIVNALQRRADVIVQKSLAEGFGLTVAEGMWKGRPVVASRIGGIQDQIEDGVTGVLIDDPEDLTEYAADVLSMLDDPEASEQIGKNARERVRDDFLGPRHLMQYVDLIGRLV